MEEKAMEMLQQILWRLDGNPSMDIEGLAPRIKKLEDRMITVDTHINHLLIKKEVKRSILKWVTTMIGIVSFIFTVFQLIKSIL